MGERAPALSAHGVHPDAAPAVSVVMPSLNQRRFLEAAVRSVLDQGIEALELLVADGGSVDGSVELLASLAAQYPGRLRWTSGADGGPAQAVNRAVSQATGPVIGWLNSDDLYEPGAVVRALDHLREVPGDVMVYGEATHVDAAGTVLGPYPTQGPGTPLAEFANGCFICQPSVFVRRAAWLAVGGLDESLHTAFDFDLWFKLFKAYPGHIGFVPVPQARSRLHEDGITLRLRKQVALEGMAVIRRHLGPAPPHWLLTHFAEMCALHPFEAEPLDLPAAMSALVDAAEPSLAAEAALMLRRRIADDVPLRLARRNFFADVYPDGWAGPVLELRLRQPAEPYTALVLRGRHASPAGSNLRLEVLTHGEPLLEVEIARSGPFEVVLPLSNQESDARQVLRIVCGDCFVPAQWEARSNDARRLAYLVDGVTLVRPAAGPAQPS